MPAVTSLRGIRRGVLRRAGVFYARTATGGSVSSLVDARSPVKSSNIQDDLFVGKWLLRPDASANDKVRIVAETGYQPATGTLQPDADWSSPPAAGEVYEIVSAVEPWDELNDLVNTALMRCYTVAEISLAATGGVTRHGLNVAAPWLQAASHVREMGFLYSGESRNTNDPYRRWMWGEPRDDEGLVFVEHPAHTFDTGEVLFARCVKAAYFSCRTSSAGTFGERQGLSADAHETPVALEWVVPAVLIEYWTRYLEQLPEGDPQAQAAAARITKLTAEYTTMAQKYLTLPPRNFWLQPYPAGGRTRWYG